MLDIDVAVSNLEKRPAPGGAPGGRGDLRAGLVRRHARALDSERAPPDPEARLQGQLAQGRIDVVEVEYSGEVAELKVAPITISVLKGILSPVRESVNLVNASHVAQELGIKVIESKVARSKDFASAVTVKVTGVVDRLVAGAVRVKER